MDEVVACLDLALDDNYITEQEHREYFNKAESIAKQLLKFSSKVRNTQKNVKT